MLLPLKMLFDKLAAQGTSAPDRHYDFEGHMRSLAAATPLPLSRLTPTFAAFHAAHAGEPYLLTVSRGGADAVVMAPCNVTYPHGRMPDALRRFVPEYNRRLSGFWFEVLELDGGETFTARTHLPLARLTARVFVDMAAELVGTASALDRVCRERF
jgi:hypothetical protein